MSATQKEESEATQFAMELLMPTAFVKDYLAIHGPFDIGDDSPIRDMAKHFKVPFSIMAIRLGGLKAEGRI